MAFSTAALLSSGPVGIGNDWTSTASKLEQALAKVGEAEAAGLEVGVLEGFYLRVEKLATDATKIMKTMRSQRSAAPQARDIAIEGIGKRADELMVEVDIRISAKRFLTTAELARSRRINLHTRPVALEPTGSSASLTTLGTGSNGGTPGTRTPVTPLEVGREERPPEYGS